MSAAQNPAVLIVEDDALIRELSTLALEEAGFEVVTAEHGEAALEALDDDADPFLAVITDIDLGNGPNGWDVAKRARELSATLPVIYVSGGSGHNWRSREVTNSLLVSKPFTIQQLVTAVTTLLRQGGLATGH